MKTISLALAALALSGCSLLWTPAYPDAGMDAFTPPDAFHLDANDDAYTPPDANADAWVRPAEICDDLAGRDEDGNGFANCDDPVCSRHATCCPMSGDPDVADFVGVPSSWTSGGNFISEGEVDFGESGYFVRTSCVPLAAGVRLTVPLVRRGEEGRLRVVLSPARAPGVEGFLDELAIQFRVGGTEAVVEATRAGALLALPEPTDACSLVRTSTSLALPSPITQTIALRLEVRPSVIAGRTVMLVNAFLDSGTYPTCTTAQQIVRDAVVDLRDLVTTGGCSGTPGLHVALEGTGAAFGIAGSGTPRSYPLTLRNYECASPGVFTVPSPATLRRSDLGDVPLPIPPAVEPAAGGVGAPSLRRQGSEWLLSFDGSEQDRASEVFAPITTQLFQSSAGMLGGAWVGRPLLPTAQSRPVTFPMGGTSLRGSFREPHQGDTNLYFSALVPSQVDAGVDADAGVSRPTYSIFRATQSDPGVFGTPSRLQLSGCANYREPTEVNGSLYYRCENGASATVGLSTVMGGTTTTRRLSDNVLGPTYATRVVRAIDIIATADRLALWVLFDGATGTELHLFLAGASTDVPTFVPFEGNPVLRASELREATTCGATEPCAVTSFTVARQGTMLHFYFARRRGTTYEFVTRTQLAPQGLR
jgi:hypothetical protein